MLLSKFFGPRGPEPEGTPSPYRIVYTTTAFRSSTTKMCGTVSPHGLHGGRTRTTSELNGLGETGETIRRRYDDRANPLSWMPATSSTTHGSPNLITAHEEGRGGGPTLVLLEAQDMKIGGHHDNGG